MKYSLLIEVLFKTISYTGLFIGLWLLTRPNLVPLINKQVRKYKNYARLRKLQLKENAKEYRKKFIFYRHLDMLLGSTWPWYSDSSVVYYLIFSCVLFSVSSVIYSRVINFSIFSILLGLITALVPYFAMLLGLSWKRSETSYELVPAVSILLGKYRVNSKDLYVSIIDTISEMNQQKMLQKSLIKLASTIQSHRTKGDLEKAVDLFVYQIGTSWAKQLGVLILNAQWEGKDIEHSLSNIVKDMGKAQEILEQQKSTNQDTIQMGLFIPIVVFPASLFFLSKILTSGNFFFFQFKTNAGLTSFIITLILCLTGFVTSLLLRKPKNEI